MPTTKFSNSPRKVLGTCSEWEAEAKTGGRGEWDGYRGGGEPRGGQVQNPPRACAGLCPPGERGGPRRPPGLRPPRGTARLPALPAPPCIKRIDNKRRVGAEKGGGTTQSLPSPSTEGGVCSPPAPAPLSNICDFLKVTPVLDPDAIKALTTHPAAQSCTHACTQNQVHGHTHSASPLAPKQPSDDANPGERSSPAPLPGKSPRSHRRPPRPLRSSLLPSALPAQGSASYAVHGFGVTPLPSPLAWSAVEKD